MKKATVGWFIEGFQNTHEQWGERIMVGGEEVFRFMAPDRFKTSPIEYVDKLFAALMSAGMFDLYMSAEPERGQDRKETLDTQLRRLRSEYPERLKSMIDNLSDDERVFLFSNYCRGCGTKSHPCHCLNDE